MLCFYWLHSALQSTNQISQSVTHFAVNILSDAKSLVLNSLQMRTARVQFLVERLHIHHRNIHSFIHSVIHSFSQITSNESIRWCCSTDTSPVASDQSKCFVKCKPSTHKHARTNGCCNGLQLLHTMSQSSNLPPHIWVCVCMYVSMYAAPSCPLSLLVFHEV